MVTFNFKADTIVDSFNIGKEEQDYIDKLFKQLIVDKRHASALWFLQRVWVDEHLTDNGKAFLVFTTGRYYEYITKFRDNTDDLSGL